MASQHSWVRRVVAELSRQGWAARQGTRHIVLYPADKTKKPFTVSGTPSDSHAQENAIKQIRRAGGNI